MRLYGLLILCVPWVLVNGPAFAQQNSSQPQSEGAPRVKPSEVSLKMPARRAVTTADVTAGPPVATPGLVIGEIRTFAFGDAAGLAKLHLEGWLECEGQSLLGVPTGPPVPGEFTKLRAALGTTWGSLDVNNVFNVPDLRGMFLRGWSHGTIPPNDTAGDPDLAGRSAPRPDMPVGSGGSAGAVSDVGSFENSAVQNHTHGGLMGGPANGADVLVYPNEGHQSAYRVATNQSGPNWYLRQMPMNPDGGGVESRPKNVYVVFCIFTGNQVIVR
jgi:hypothetical protein